jgi:hypothetical protein
LSLIEYPERRLADAPDDIRLFDAVGTTVGVNVIGAELVPRFLDASHRHTLSSAGLLVGLGFGSGQLDDRTFSFVTISGGVFIRPLSFLQLETGLTAGAAFDDTFTQKGDGTVYYGLRVNIRPLVDILDDVAEVLF